jgi:hypothetical protein
MDREPEIASFGSRAASRWGWVVVIACLALAVAHLADVTSQRDATISQLRAALRAARAHQAAGVLEPQVSPAETATAFHSFPDGRHGSFSVVAAAISSRPGAEPTLWLYVHGHAQAGQRYGLLGDMCGGEFVTSSDLAEATADRHGDLTMVAGDLPVQLTGPRQYLLVYQMDSGDTLGGIKGPLLSAGATPFRLDPPC